MKFKKFLGEIMANMGLVTREQLKEALRRQREIIEEETLPEQLHRSSIVSEARQTEDTTPLLGQILTDMGFVTKEQLEKALSEQNKLTQIYGSLNSEKLGIALEMGSIVNSTLNLAGVLTIIMGHANRVTNSAASTLMLLDEKTGELVFSVPTGPEADKLTDIRLPPGKGIPGWVVENEQPVFVHNAKEDPRFYPEIDKIRGIETKSILCVPLKAKTKLIGVLEVINKFDKSSFNEEDALFLNIFASQAAIAIENARLYSELKDQLDEHKQAEESLAKLNLDLEHRVDERTVALVKANDELKQEIKERKQAEEALRESEEKYRNILEGVEEGYFEVDLSGNLTFANIRSCTTMGYSRDELLGMNNREYTTPETARKMYQVFNQVYRTGEPAQIHDYEVVRKDGTKIFLGISTSLIKDRDGRPIGFRGTFRDVSERLHEEEEKKRIEAQLQQTQKLESIAVLADGMAHDFNNLLTRIRGNIDIAKEDLRPGSESYTILSEAEKECVRARELTRRFRAFSNDSVSNKKTGTLTGLIEDWINRALSGSEVRSECFIPDDLWLVEFSEKHIKRVIHNLILNADEAMPEGGIIRVSAENITCEGGNGEIRMPRKEGNYVKISIQDEGMGISEDHLPKVFDPYFSTKEIGTQQGMGLGLAVSYSIIKKHDGYIYFDSQVGVGTTVNIYLPASEE